MSGAGLMRLASLTRLRALELHHWVNTLAPLSGQLLRVPAGALPPGLTSLQALYVQLELEGMLAVPTCGGEGGLPARDGGSRLSRRSLGSSLARFSLGSGASGSGLRRQSLPSGGKGGAGSASGAHPLPRSAWLAPVFGSLKELHWVHGDHAAADRLLAAALPHCGCLEQLHVSGPGAFHHTPLAQAAGYGAAYGAEAASLFLLPWATWLPTLVGRGAPSAGGVGGSWLRQIACLGALRELHLDLPLALPAQVEGTDDGQGGRDAAGHSRRRVPAQWPSLVGLCCTFALLLVLAQRVRLLPMLATLETCSAARRPLPVEPAHFTQPQPPPTPHR